MFGDGIKIQRSSQITTDFRFIISTLDKNEQKWGHCEIVEGFIKCLSISGGSWTPQLAEVVVTLKSISHVCRDILGNFYEYFPVHLLSTYAESWFEKCWTMKIYGCISECWKMGWKLISLWTIQLCVNGKSCFVLCTTNGIMWHLWKRNIPRLKYKHKRLDFLFF